MAMRPKLWSLNGLSVELGIGARALAKKLKHTPPDGKVGGREGWYMSSAVSAIENDRGGNGGGYGGSDRDAVLDEIQRITAKLDAGFSQMAAEPDVARRRKIATEVGPLVGALNRAIERSHEFVPSDERPFVKLGTDQILRQAIANFMGLCQYELSDDDDAADAA